MAVLVRGSSSAITVVLSPIKRSSIKTRLTKSFHLIYTTNFCICRKTLYGRVVELTECKILSLATVLSARFWTHYAVVNYQPYRRWCFTRGKGVAGISCRELYTSAGMQEVQRGSMTRIEITRDETRSEIRYTSDQMDKVRKSSIDGKKLKMRRTRVSMSLHP